MSNILPPAGAESVHFSPPVVDNESSEPHRDREALASVLKEGWIAGFGDAPLPDEELRPGRGDIRSPIYQHRFIP